MTRPLPNSLISLNVPAFTNDDFSGSFPASNANNATYNDTWRCAAAPPTSGSPVYLAYDLSGVSSANRANVVLVWYNDGVTGAYDYTLISANPANEPASYTIEVNAGAGGGSPPVSSWVNIATITGEHYHSRQFSFSMTGYNWVRMVVTAENGADPNNNVAINMDVHTAPHGLTDDWIFYGDSITQQSFLHLDPTLPAEILSGTTTNFPIMESGGIGGFTALDGATNISTWLPLFPGKYVGLLYGTNDANQGGTYMTNYIANMTTMITAILNAGKIPVLPTTICWGGTTNLLANAPTINADIQTLKNTFPQIILGPDLYAYFNANQGLIDGTDHIHPTLPDGYAAYRAQWVSSLLAGVYNPASATTQLSPSAYPHSSAHYQGTGGMLPVAAPAAPYRIAGTPIDTPWVCTAPLMSTSVHIPAGNSFVLTFNVPSTPTQALLVDGSQVSMTFALADGEMATGQVKLSVLASGSFWVVSCTIMSPITLQRS